MSEKEKELLAGAIETVLALGKIKRAGTDPCPKR